MYIASNMKQLFFNWLSAVTDFFGIFVVVCWVFYEPTDEDLQQAFSVIQNVWLYKLYIFVIPCIGIPSVILWWLYAYAIASQDDDYHICTRIFGFFVCIILCGVMWVMVSH